MRSAGTQTCDDNDAENKDNDAGEDGVNDDVDDEDLHDDDEGSTQPLGGKGQQGEEEHVRSRVRNELDKRVSHEPGQQEISLGPNITFKSSTSQHLSVVP